MKIKKSALRKIIREAIDSDRIISERPWSVEFSFRLSGGIASDSEGSGPDGFQITMKSQSGAEAKITVDSYWNPQAGDSSGNSLKFSSDKKEESSYVPHRFDDGKEQMIILSNAPVSRMIAISHAISKNDLPVVYLIVPNPFEVDDDVEFDIESNGNGKAEVKLKRHTNL